jgi:hypothetical protein
MQNDAAKTIEQAVTDARKAIADSPNDAIFNQDVPVYLNGKENVESLASMLLVLQTATGAIKTGNDYDKAREIYHGGQALAFQGLDYKWKKLLQTMDLEANAANIKLWQPHETNLIMLNSALRREMDQGGKTV